MDGGRWWNTDGGTLATLTCPNALGLVVWVLVVTDFGRTFVVVVVGVVEVVPVVTLEAG